MKRVGDAGERGGSGGVEAGVSAMEGFGGWAEGTAGGAIGAGLARKWADVDHERRVEIVRTAGEGGGEARSGTGLYESGADGVAEEVVDKGRLAKADLGLGGMDIDVNLFGRHFEEEKDNGKAGGRKDVAIGLGEGVEDEAVADETAIDEDVDGVAVEFLELGFGDEAGDAKEAGVGSFVVLVALPGWGLGQAGAAEVHLGGEREHEDGGFAAEDLEEAVGGARDRGCDEQGLGAGVELEVARGVGEGVMGDEGGDVGELGLFGFEELAAGRGIEEEVANGDGGTDRNAGGIGAEDVAAGNLDQGAGIFCRAAVFGGGAGF